MSKLSFPVAVTLGLLIGFMVGYKVREPVVEHLLMKDRQHAAVWHALWLLKEKEGLDTPLNWMGSEIPEDAFIVGKDEWPYRLVVLPSGVIERRWKDGKIDLIELGDRYKWLQEEFWRKRAEKK